MGHEYLDSQELEALLIDATGDTTERPALPSFVDRFQMIGANLAESLVELLGQDVSVRTKSTERRSCGDYLLRSRDPSLYYVVRLQPDAGHLMVELPASLTGLLLDHMLGAPQPTDRLPASELEIRLIGKVVRKLCDAFEKAWQDLIILQAVVERAVADRSLARCFDIHDELTIVTLQVGDGQSLAELKLSLISAWMPQLIVGRLADNANQATDSDDAAGVTEREYKALVEIVVQLAQTSITPQEFSELSVGDIITTSKDVGEPLLVAVDGHPAFRGNLGKLGDKKAIQIVERLVGGLSARKVPTEDTGDDGEVEPED